MLNLTKTILAAIALTAIFGFYGWREILISQQSPKSVHENKGTTASQYEPNSLAPFRVLAANGLKEISKYCNSYPEHEKKNWPQTYYCDLKITDVYIALFSGLLVFVTFGLVWIGIQQYRDTRILQRAYLSVEPMGVENFKISEQTFAHVGFANTGHLPAQNVRWVIKTAMCSNGQRSVFAISDKELHGAAIVAPGALMRQHQTDSISEADFVNFTGGSLFYYVWGTINYTDGFKVHRFTNFCHLYSAFGYQSGYYRITAESGRFHVHGNYTDEQEN